MNERWLPVAGFDGRYDVSNHGRVRTWVLRVGTRVGRRSEPVILADSAAGANRQYRKVCLFDEVGGHQHLVHRLVATAFIGPCPPGHQAAHEDGIGSHNTLANLSWKTVAENQADKRRHGTHVEGERSARHRLTERQVREILSDGRRTSGPTLAAKYGVNHKTIYAILHGRTWKHVSGATR